MFLRLAFSVSLLLSAGLNTAGAESQTVNVAPGNNGTEPLFVPAHFDASNGTSVLIYFPNVGPYHSFTQSSFDKPCTPLQDSENVTIGFDSGLTSATEWELTITNATIPIYFFSKGPNQCGQGMVGAINAPQNGTGSYDEFYAAAVKLNGTAITVPDTTPILTGVGAAATGPPRGLGERSDLQFSVEGFMPLEGYVTSF
ncbi:hypothetical protein NLI96_g10254 [Meripilus lineatus]|uniref:Extracellular serine-rich protein n=1 Tax=Meripilus lineatus TaxID=2056292 RepID=A0AAD5UYK3_9APHY|nr:hypothetical protein NLI96_g10254 [Physisporinus lineatus]